MDPRDQKMIDDAFAEFIRDIDNEIKNESDEESAISENLPGTLDPRIAEWLNSRIDSRNQNDISPNSNKSQDSWGLDDFL